MGGCTSQHVYNFRQTNQKARLNQELCDLRYSEVYQLAGLHFFSHRGPVCESKGTEGTGTPESGSAESLAQDRGDKPQSSRTDVQPLRPSRAELNRLLPLEHKCLDRLEEVESWNAACPLGTQQLDAPDTDDHNGDALNCTFRDAGGNTLLHWAAVAGHERMVEQLLERGHEVNVVNKFQVTPNQAAVLLNKSSVVDLLLCAGDDPSHKGAMGMTLLHSAVLCEEPKPMLLKILAHFGYTADSGSKAEANLAALEAEAKANEKAEAAAAEKDLDELCEKWSQIEAEAADGKHPDSQQQLLQLQLDQQELMQKQQHARQEQHKQYLQEHKKRVAAVQQEYERFHAYLEKLDCHSQSALVLAINRGCAASVEVLLAAKASMHTRIHYAAHHGHTKMVNELLNKKAPADNPDDSQMTPLLKAARGGHADCIVMLLNSTGKVDLHRKMLETGASSLLLAAAGTDQRHAKAVEVLIKYGANLEDKDAAGNTPLLAACNAGNVAVLTKLVNRNVDLDATNNNMDTGLHLAAREGHKNCVDLLLLHQATQDLRNLSGETPYVAALRAGQEQVAKLLQDNGSNPHYQLHWAVENADTANEAVGTIPSVTDQLLGQTPVNLQDTRGISALHAAARKGNDHAVLQLLESKADPNIAAGDGSTALISASENGHAVCCKLLLACHANVGACTHAKRTALHLAARNNHHVVVQQLLEVVLSLPFGDIKASESQESLEKQEKDIDAQNMSDVTITSTLTSSLLQRLSSVKNVSLNLPAPAASAQHPLLQNVILDAQDRGGSTAVCLAAKYGSLESVEMLVSGQADVHVVDYRGWSPLHHAAYNGKLETAKVLIAKAGAPIDQASQHGESPLIFAADQNHLNVVKLLLLNEANISAQNAYGQSALTMAARNGHCQIIEHLISKGSDIEHQDVAGCTPLMAASRNNRIEAVRLLLAHKACVNPPLDSPDAALHSAAEFAGVEVVEALLEAGADPNFSVHGNLPLKYAAKRGDLAMVKLLLKSESVKPDSVDADQVPVLHFAIREGHIKVVEELLKEGADINSKDWKGNTPLINAAFYGKVDICKILFDHKADVTHTAFGGVMAVHRAAQAGHLDVLKLFLLPLGDSILDKFVATTSGQTLMHIAASYGQADVMRWLLYDVGLDINQTCQGQTLKREGIKWKQWNRTSLNISGNIIQSLTEDEGFEGPALASHLLTNDRQLSYAEFEILEGGHPCNVSFGLGIDNGRYDYLCGHLPDTVGLNGLDGYCLTGSQSTIKQYTSKFGRGDTIGLLYNPAFRSLSYTRNGVHLGIAAQNLTPGQQTLMIGFGAPGIKLEANFYESLDYKYEKLFEASFDELLMEEEQTQNPGNLVHPWKLKDKVCPLHMAASSKCISSLKMLLELGAVVDQKDADGWSALHYASLVGWEEGATLLLQYKADPNMMSLYDSTPIFFSVKFSHAGVTRVLLDHGAKCCEKDRKNRTLLMWAAYTGNSATIQMLLEQDVPIKTKDNMGRTALQYACNEKVVTSLEDALNELHTYRGIFQISKQQEIFEGSAGKVLLAKHVASGNVVAIKFYRDRVVRDYAAKVLHDLAAAYRYIAAIPKEMKFDECIFECNENHTPGFPYALVTEGGMEDLLEAMGKSGATPMPENQIRYIFECICGAVVVLHRLGRVHHDLKCTNLVRFFDGSYRLVDLDNSRIKGMDESGMTSLEICPPEMASALLTKASLKSDFSADMWALGCILYEMVTHTQFLPQLKREWAGRRRVENSILAEGLELLQNLKQYQVDEVLDSLVEKKKGRMLIEQTSDLMKNLLKVDPMDRFTAEDVQQHSFLKGGLTATMDEKSIAGVRNTLNIVHSKVDQVLSIAMDIQDRTVSIHLLSQETRDGIAACARKISGLRSLVMAVATRSECPTTFTISPDIPPKELLRPDDEKSAAFSCWLKVLKELTTGKKDFDAAFKLIAGVKTLRLSLVCEQCLEPQTSYRIEENPPFVAKLMPAFQVGLQVVKLYNLGASIGRFFFPALPAVPSELVSKSQDFIDKMDCKSSAEEFNCIQMAIDQHKDEKERSSHGASGGQQLGVAYRELSGFLARQDPSRDWGGLTVVLTNENEEKEGLHGVEIKGNPPGVLWVCKACLTSAHQVLKQDKTKKAMPTGDEQQQQQQPSPSQYESTPRGLCGLVKSPKNKIVPM